MTAPHDKLAGIKPGDRVRVTYEGVVTRRDTGLAVDVDVDNELARARAYIAAITVPEIAAPTFQIERIEPPLAAFDKVVTSQPSHCHGEIVAVSGDQAWVFWEHNRTNTILPLSGLQRRQNLERIA